MRNLVLSTSDYGQEAKDLAPALVGKVLCRRISTGEVWRRVITETECYSGIEDTACHAHKGRTPRTSVMFQQGGVAYVYLCYGIHHLLNVVTGPEGHPQAVLIRGVEGFAGPGRLTKGMCIDRQFNGLSLCEETGLWLEDHGYRPKVEAGRRIGIGYASAEDQARLWRFYTKEQGLL